MNFNQLKSVLDAVTANPETITGTESYTEAELKQFLGANHLQNIVMDNGDHYIWSEAKNIQTTPTGGTSTTSGNCFILMCTKGTKAGDRYSSVTVTDLGLSTGVTSDGTIAAGICVTPIPNVISSVGAALGLHIDLGALSDVEGFNVDFTPYTVNGKVVTFLDNAGKSYISEALVYTIKEALISAGAYSGGGISGGIESDTPVQVDTIAPTSYLAYLVSSLQKPDNLSEAGFANFKNQIITFFPQMLNYSSYGDISSYKIFYIDVFIGYIGNWKAKVWIKAGSTDTVSSGHYTQGSNGSVTTEASQPADYREFTIEYSTLSGNSHTSYPNGLLTLSPSLPYPGIVDATQCRIDGINIGRSQAAIPGVEKEEGATYPTQGTPIDLDFPTWTAGKRYIDNAADIIHVTGQNRRGVLPCSMALTYETLQSIDQDDAQAGNQGDNDQQAESGEEIPNQNPSDNTPTDNTGENTTPTTPSGTVGTGFIKVYNPTYQQLADFSDFLWSGFDVNTFLKVIQDPMECIIGLHYIFCTPSRSQFLDHVYFGNLDSGIEMYPVTDQYTNIDFGSVTINRYFNNVLDYIDTEIQIFLPFVGFVQLSPKELVGATVNLKGTVDVVTGTIMYMLWRDNQILYTFSGQCSIQLPITGSNYQSLIGSITGLIAAAGAGVATIATGGAAAPAVIAGIGAGANAAVNTHMNVQRSGGIGGNAGAMGPKKPYLLITRHKPYNPSGYENFYGYPSNEKVTLKNCHGYTRIKDVIVNNIPATSTELAEIENILKGGIII